MIIFSHLRFLIKFELHTFYCWMSAELYVSIKMFGINEMYFYLIIWLWVPYFEKINLFFNIIIKKVWINSYGLIEIICSVYSKYPQSDFTRHWIARYAGYTVCTTWLRLLLDEPNTNCDQSLIKYVRGISYNILS